jgi:ribosomal protein L37AE/L43A
MANSNPYIPVTPFVVAKPNQPPACPKCGSRDTSSAAKRPDANSYWRCLKCGDVWNPAQLVGTSVRRWPR